VRSAPLARSPLRRSARASSSAPDFEQVFRDHHQEIYRYCLAIVRNSADAEDALQATMAAALRALEADDRDMAIRPWLFRVAHNESISMLRRRREHGVGEELPEVATDSAAEELDARERLRALVADLRALPDRQRSALVMRELSGLSYSEIGAALECAEGAARQVVHEARTALYTLAEGREMRCDQARTALGGDRRRLRGRKLKAHLAACEPCRDFQRAIEVRERDLRALCPPLPIAAAGGILSAVIGGGGAGPTGAVGAGTGGGATAGGAAAGGAAGASSAGAVGAGASAVAGGLAGSAAVKGASLAAAAVVAIGGVADLTGAIALPGPLHIGGKQAAEESAGAGTGGGQVAERGDEAPSAAGRPGSARAKQARVRGVEASTRKGANGEARVPAPGLGRAYPGAGGNGNPGGAGGLPPQAQGNISPPHAGGNPTPPTAAGPPPQAGELGSPGGSMGPGGEAASPPANRISPGAPQGSPDTP
jgi:RNA polymerase sigma factor (sigma-70 family)